MHYNSDNFTVTKFETVSQHKHDDATESRTQYACKRINPQATYNRSIFAEDNDSKLSCRKEDK